MALTDTASVAISALSASPAQAARDSAGGGRTYYVDSQVGDDSNDGTLSTSAPNSAGPWRTLTRLARASLSPGDTVQLACGSLWSEALRLPNGGTASQPITIAAAPNCTTRPSIDGSVSLTGELWAQHSGNVFKARLDQVPLLLSSAGTPWNEAHHPNVGTVAADANSPYLSLAADGNSVTLNGLSGSTQLSTGTDLPATLRDQVRAGTRVRVRTNAWLLEERTVASVGANTLTLTQPTSYVVSAGWGYLLVGQLWMVDSAGEWFYDATSKTLFAYMADGKAPAAGVTAATLPLGLDLAGKSFVTIDGLAVRNVGDGADLRKTQGVTLRNMVFADIANRGVDATNSGNAKIESSTFDRTGAEAVSGWRGYVEPGTGMTVSNNVLRNIGVRVADGKVTSTPHGTDAAVFTGPGATVTGNLVVSTSYHGLRLASDSRAAGNVVVGACALLDDCGAIYLWGASNTTIAQNIVLSTRGSAAGRPAASAWPVVGIYLDNATQGVVVQDNTVADADHGVLLNSAAQNTVQRNTLYGNRLAQLALSATSNERKSTGDVFGNSISDNLFSPSIPGAVAVLLQNPYASVTGFGGFKNNRFLNNLGAYDLMESSAAGQRGYSLDQWRSANRLAALGSATALGTSTAQSGFASFRPIAASIVPNGNLSLGSGGWSTWNQVAPAAQMSSEACAAGTCLRYVAGGAPSLISTPNFTVQKGQWYRLSFDISADRDDLPVAITLRRGGGGSNGFEPLSDRTLDIVAGSAWRRYTVLLQATKTVNARDSVTGDNGARVDIAGVDTGVTLRIASLELVPISMDGLASISMLLVNGSGAPSSIACPFVGAQSTVCAALRNLTDGSAASWPATMASRTALVLFGGNAALVDSDGDGIADAIDACPGTPAGVAVNAAGCPLILR